MADDQLELPDGSVVSLAHLAPMPIACPCASIGRDLVINVTFRNHCYTEKFQPGIHTREQIVLYDSPSRPRVFCPVRYGLSTNLREIAAELPNKRVHQTTQVRNYVYVATLVESNQFYEVYFMLQRARPEDGCDLNLVVESAYPSPAAPAVPKRPQTIRFQVLAHKVLLNQSVRFAAR